MLANNNQQVVSRLAKRSLRSSKSRSIIMIAAVMLSSFMLFSVLTVGTTYFKMQRVQDMRLNGAEYDAIMYGVTPAQQELCENNPDITAAGVMAVAGYVIETEADNTPNVGLLWADDTYWNTMKKPAIELQEGQYPQEADEIMVTKEALKECKMEDLSVGDSITFKYGDALGEYTKKFRISGMWDGFGSKKAFFVSEAFYKQSGQELSSVSSGRYHLDFKKKIMTQKEQDTFIESMHLEKQQRLFFLADSGHSFGLLAGMAGLILITCLCAYLLIYNIMYLSVSGNIRYYGLLQTVGMTGRQIYKLMQKQMLFIGTVGTAGGMLLGSGVSFFLIPTVVKSLGIRSAKAGDITVAFHPAVFLLTILFTGLTVRIGSRKPAKMAVSVSPVEALGYRPAGGRKSIRRTGKGRLLWRMAKDQLTKDKKKSTLVILSLAAGLSVFLCMITLIESQGARTIVSNFMDMDLVIKNDTLKKEDREEWTQILDEVLLDKIRGNPAVKAVTPMLSAEIIVPWESDFTDIWMREFYEMWMTIPYEDDIEEYKAHPENFGSFLVGIDDAEFDYLNSTLQSQVDKESFLNGKTCILYLNGMEFKISDLQGKKVTCAEYANVQNSRTFEIAGLTGETYYAGALIGYPPTIIVSDRVAEDFIPNAFVYKTGIRYEEEFDQKAEEDMFALLQADTYAEDFSWESKIEEMEMVKKAQGNMMEVGIGIVLILAFIGLLNYLNTVTGNIQSRQVELAILESVGMTERQVTKMLMLEGILFAGCSLLLAATVGTEITYWLYQSMNYRNIAFSVPVLPVLGMTIFIILVCIEIPLGARYFLAKKGSVVERIRGFE